MYNPNDKNDEHLKVIPFLVEGDFYFSIAVKAFQKRDFNKAIKWFKRAMELNPKNPLYPCQLSVLYTEIRSYHKANQLLTKVLADFGEEYADCYYLIANNYAHLGLFQDAQKNIEMYLKKEPQGEFAEEAAQLLEMLELYNDEEEEDYEDDDWLFDEEDELLIYQETVFYHLENHEWEEALPILEEMIDLYPEYKVAKHDYAWALFFAGNREAAVELELEWQENDQNSTHSIVNLAIFYHLMGKEELSIGYIETLKNVYPIHEQQRLKIAIALAYTGHYDLAYERFQYLSKGNLRDHVSYFKWYSKSAYQLGLGKLADQLWQEGCRRHPFLQKIGKIENVK
ncbi:tetratricopeptide (TPR) repeat protein [Salirhabdus euzebyi]|uniref:Tetratricopeptide (TPR) repeat protein n=1 Tax=Salirhabdus euzebyi TaxID=394506 RepID=A0A841Q5E9_9BACI|nr:tetratricopeptide repeat protein [Salirhabdus euzebyi]MBB6453583.1 tetratricopeptide (TPR) repeat protein [Salirhabdus euzebyi]